ncbi:hypothetical protein Ciccas_005704 [Cichlidogyrus casuarinus]|uniref:Uncharacterized protein n=1 Tax=Cichlidogyrus casuarinus TaxID=1844966 RepID=A0ABD2Q7W6_9PLAT
MKPSRNTQKFWGPQCPQASPLRTLLGEGGFCVFMNKQFEVLTVSTASNHIDIPTMIIQLN